MENSNAQRTASRELRQRTWDWLTALSPVVMMMVVNYRPQSVWAMLAAAGGFFAVNILWYNLRLMPCRLGAALLCGVLVACCVSSTTAVWLTAIAGMVGGMVVVIPSLLERWFPTHSFYCPVYLPAMVGYLTVRYVFSARFAGFSLPVMWEQADVVASATPLAALWGGAPEESLKHLFWNVDAGSIGGGPAIAVLLGLAYLWLCRRAHPLTVSAMLATVALLSWQIWGQPWYALLAGGTLLAAVLAGDEGITSMGWKGRLTAGVLVGAVTVFCRARWQIDGAALGLVVVGVLMPLLQMVYGKMYRFARTQMEKFAKTEN